MLPTRIEARRKFLSLSVKALLASSALTFSAALITTIYPSAGTALADGGAGGAKLWQSGSRQSAARTVRRVLEGVASAMPQTAAAAAVPV